MGESNQYPEKCSKRRNFLSFARMCEKGSAYKQSLAPRVLLMNAVKVEEMPKLFVLFARMWEKESAYRQSLTPRADGCSESERKA